MKDLSIYIHIPYCQYQCRYCSFFTVIGKPKNAPLYFRALEKEIDSYKSQAKKYIIRTIYFGGGTPSLVNAHHIKSIVDKLKSTFIVANDVDISIETNPESLDEEKLNIYKSIGINRISVGLQAAQDKLLRYLGRSYKFELFDEKIRLVKSKNFDAVNIDLIFGIPTQTFEMWKETLDKVVSYKPDHIACYTLELENDSYWGKLYKKGKLKSVPDVLDRKMYHFAIKRLKEEGYEQYEISNFARNKNYSKHNLSFWSGGEYLGLGAGAFSYFNKKRFNNIENIETYMRGVLKDEKFREDVVRVNKATERFENIMVGLRLIKGLDLINFNKKFKIDFHKIYERQIESLRSKKLISITKNRLKLTAKGIDLLNQVVMEFVV